MINFIFKKCGESVDKDTIAMILDIQEEFLASYGLIDIDEDDIPKLIGFLKRQEANGKFFSKAMQKEPVANTEEV